ncbi:MAG: hypothetical protein H7Z72_15815 [Bacteroidetes bacterium]|nr:hypothetical protein [Fibrella sp.]
MKLKIVVLLWLCGGGYQLAVGQRAPTGKKSVSHAQPESGLNQVKSAYQAQLQTWCDGLIAIQVKGGDDAGGIFCNAHQFSHGRCGDALYPFLTLFKLTGQEKYRTAARNVFNWSEAHVSQPDGSWLNEAAGRNNWKGITCFSTIALGEALRHHGDVLSDAENKQWRARLRKGGDYMLSSFTFETGDVNYPIAAGAALAVCWTVLGDEKYRQRAREFTYFGLTHFTANNLIWGEGIRGKSDTTATGLRPIDIPYNLEESMANFALYGLLTGDAHVLDAVTTSLRAHLNWMLPDGGLDAGWCARQYKWTYFGSSTADGPMGGLALMASRDKRFAEAAFRSLQVRQSYTHNGLLHGGGHLATRKLPVCSHHTFTNAKGLATALDAGISEAAPVSLPADSAYGVREWPEARVVQIAVGPWRASVTINDLASSPKRGGHPMGGALTMLWHQQTGPVAVASMNDYVTYEKANMQTVANDADKVCLTPRIETSIGGSRYSNLYDSQATLTWVKKGDAVLLTINGNLRDVAGHLLPGGASAFELNYTFTPRSFQLAVQSKAAGARLLFPVVSPADESVRYTVTGTVTVQKKMVLVNLTGNETGEWKGSTAKRVFNFVPGFEAIPISNKLNSDGTGYVRIEVTN